MYISASPRYLTIEVANRPDFLRRIIGRRAVIARLAQSTDYRSAIGPIADLLVFYSALAGGAGVERAQIASFGAATALNYFVRIRAVLAASGRTGDLRLHGRLTVVNLCALFLRAGVISLLTTAWGWPAQLAIFAAIIAAAAVTQPGNAFCLSTSVWRFGSTPRWRELALGVIAYALVLRLVYCGQAELLPEEAYYWNYSRHLDIGYLDHPPMVAWLIWLGTAAFGDSAFGVRIGALCCGIIASVFAYRLTKHLFDEPSALVAAVLMQTLPFFFMSGLLMTPDAPLTAAWAASLYFLERALVAGRSAAWWWAGTCLGIGLLSKYSIGLLGPAVLIFMLLDPQSRSQLRDWKPYAAALLALAIFSPTILWNARHEWASFAFQTSRRLAQTPKFALHSLIASTLVLITPTGVLATAAALFGRKQERRQWRFIRVSVLGPFAVFLAFSLRHEVKLDWAGALMVGAVPAMAHGIVHSGPKLIEGLRGWIQAAWTPTIAAVLLLLGAGLYYLTAGLPGVGYSKHVELIPAGWRDLGRQVGETAGEIATRDGVAPLIVGMDRYAMASELAFYAPDLKRAAAVTSGTHLFGDTGLMYEQWFPAELQAGRTLLLVAWDPRELAGEKIESRVQRLEPVRQGVLVRDGKLIRSYYYRVAYGYRNTPAMAMAGGAAPLLFGSAIDAASPRQVE
jgi:dolichol-phosphate mannosyltransferase